MVSLYILISILLIGYLLMTRDLPIITGSILASGAGERMGFRILAPIVLIVGLILPDILRLTNDSAIFSLPLPENTLPVGLATLTAVLIVERISHFPALPYAFMAAIAGVSVALGEGFDWDWVGPLALSWLVAPILCLALGAGFYALMASFHRKRKLHMVVQESRIMTASIIVGILLLAAFSQNNNLILNHLAAGMKPAITIAIVVISSVAIFFVFIRKYKTTEWAVADIDLDINSQSVLSLLLAMTVTFAIFTTPIPSMIGLTATPLPAGTLYLAALLGISLVRGRALAEGRTFLGAAAAMLLSPVIATIVAYSLAQIMFGGTLGALAILGITILAVALMVYSNWQNQRNIKRQLLSNREKQVYSTQKSLSALEVKAEMTERDLLNKLDIKRKELVDFAVGVSDQKDFMENVFHKLTEIRSMNDGSKKNHATDALLGTLRERMYFTSEVNDFYARSEVLNKDFNMRLDERFPNLTDNERKLTNLLRQGFSSKYIASLMNITPKSVEINRSRLRAKLGLDRSDNLVKFIKSI